MSKLRPTLSVVGPNDGRPVMRNGTAYLMILNAVKERPGLLHGRLESRREYCAIGSYFHVNDRTVLPTDLIDEVAAVNDSIPHATQRQRRLMVLRWLRWKLTSFGMIGFKTKKKRAA